MDLIGETKGKIKVPHPLGTDWFSKFVQWPKKTKCPKKVQNDPPSLYASVRNGIVASFLKQGISLIGKFSIGFIVYFQGFFILPPPPKNPRWDNIRLRADARDVQVSWQNLTTLKPHMYFHLIVRIPRTNQPYPTGHRLCPDPTPRILYGMRW